MATFMALGIGAACSVLGTLLGVWISEKWDD